MQNTELPGECETCPADLKQVSGSVMNLQPSAVNPAPPSLFIVSDDQGLCDTLARILGTEYQAAVRVMGDFSAATAQATESSRIRILVLDTASLSLNSRGPIRALRAAAPDLRILLINVTPDENMFGEIAELNLEGYLCRDATVSEIVAAVGAVMHGATVCPPEFLRILLKQTRIMGPPDFSSGPQIRSHPNARHPLATPGGLVVGLSSSAPES
jgi:DNA-binding NarL/FixJ family response regulator